MRIEVWCDGACSGNPGPGGWGAILIARDTATGAEVKRREISGGSSSTTNNRMELTAVLMALAALERPANVQLLVDSKYVMDGFERGWVRSWKRNGWRTVEKKPVANRELWEQLDEQIARHQVRWVKVRGHAGVAINEQVDRLAVAACVRHGGRQDGSGARPSFAGASRRSGGHR